MYYMENFSKTKKKNWSGADARSRIELLLQRHSRRSVNLSAWGRTTHQPALHVLQGLLHQVAVFMTTARWWTLISLKKKRRVQDLNLQAPKDGTLAKCWLTISLTLQRSRYVRYSYINDLRHRHFAGCIFIVVQVRFELTLERVWAVCLCQLGYRTIYLIKKLPVMESDHRRLSQSHLYYFYTNGQSKTRYCRHFSGRYCFALSFQASISFPQVQAVSAANIMSLIHAGRGRRLWGTSSRQLPYVTPHLRRYKNVDVAVSTF